MDEKIIKRILIGSIIFVAFLIFISVYSSFWNKKTEESSDFFLNITSVKVNSSLNLIEIYIDENVGENVFFEGVNFILSSDSKNETFFLNRSEFNMFNNKIILYPKIINVSNFFKLEIFAFFNNTDSYLNFTWVNLDIEEDIVKDSDNINISNNTAASYETVIENKSSGGKTSPCIGSCSLMLYECGEVCGYSCGTCSSGGICNSNGRCEYTLFNVSSSSLLLGGSYNDSFGVNGGGSIEWNYSVSSTLFFNFTYPLDIESYNYTSVGFWVYNKEAYDGRFSLVIESDNLSLDGKDYYIATVFTNFSGWKFVQIPFSDFNDVRDPIGWNYITSIRFYSYFFIWDYLDKNYSLSFGDFKLIDKSSPVGGSCISNLDCDDGDALSNDLCLLGTCTHHVIGLKSYLAFEELINPFTENRTPSETDVCVVSRDFDQTHYPNVCVAVNGSFDEIELRTSDKYSRSGNKSIYFSIKPTPLEFWPGSGNSTFRSELAPKGGTYGIYPWIGEERWYGFSVFIPEDFQTLPDNVSEAGRFSFSQWINDLGSPTVELNIAGNEMQLIRHCSNSTPVDRCEETTFSTVSDLKGKWTDLIVRIIWDKNDGLIQIWKNQELVYNKSNIQTIYFNLDRGGRHKMGVYCWPWKEYDNVNKTLEAGVTKFDLYFDEIYEYQGSDGYDFVNPDKS